MRCRKVKTLAKVDDLVNFLSKCRVPGDVVDYPMSPKRKELR